MVFNITKKFIKMFSKDDPRREEFKKHVERIEAEFKDVVDRPEWLDKHRVGVKTVSSLSVFWWLAVKPLEEIIEKKEVLPAKGAKLVRRFNKAIKMLKIDEVAYKMDVNTPVEERMKKMSVMDIK